MYNCICKMFRKEWRYHCITFHNITKQRTHCNVVQQKLTSQHGVKGRQFWQSQVASINDEDDSFKLLQDSVNELKSRGLVDGYLTVDDYVNIDFEVCTSETSAITDREILGFYFNQRVKR